VTQGSGGGEAITRRGPGGNSGAVRTGSGDVYAGRDGNVYRRQDGSWQKWDNGSWGAAETPTPRDRTSTGGTGAADRAGTTNRTPATGDTVGQLDRDRAARTEGATRTRDYGTTRTSPQPRSGSGYGGSYRTGGSRGGGGRRR
jgi:hypothetical protein